MNKRVYLIISALLLSSLIVSTFAQVTVGLKEADWIEYEITYTGTPPDWYPENARFEVLTIQGTRITLELKTKALDGTENTNNVTFSLEDGAPDFIIIPANLNIGDEVYHKEVGSIKILGIEEYTYEGDTRELVYGSFVDLDYNWDRKTGIVIQIDQTTDTYTQSWLAVNTNIVQTQALDLDPMILYGTIIAVVGIILIIVAGILKRKK
ncbi:MAG: hypothetical protein AC479_02965 [miscellaneous Crenarchaeota group-6 archaeon AD8-1]|nr:MAG: hypothetical protein AC479_02965 [miscellaneous Crenarchaeota group-6 archaeon AD8-1]